MTLDEYVQECVNLYNSTHDDYTSDDADIWGDLYHIGVTPQQAMLIADM